MALFGGMFGGEKHPKLDQLSLAIQSSLGLQLVPPGDDVLGVIEAMTPHDLIGFQNARSIEGAQEVFKAKSLRAIVDDQARTMALSIGTPEEIERELNAAHSVVEVLHVSEHRAAARIIKPLGPAIEPVKPKALASVASTDTAAPPTPPAFEHLEAAERLCPVIVDLLVKHGQLTTADKEVLKKIKPTDSTLEARVVVLERWKTELSRRARGIHVQQTGSTSLLASVR